MSIIKPGDDLDPFALTPKEREWLRTDEGKVALAEMHAATERLLERLRDQLIPAPLSFLPRAPAVDCPCRAAAGLTEPRHRARSDWTGHPASPLPAACLVQWR